MKARFAILLMVVGVLAAALGCAGLYGVRLGHVHAQHAPYAATLTQAGVLIGFAGVIAFIAVAFANRRRTDPSWWNKPTA